MWQTKENTYRGAACALSLLATLTLSVTGCGGGGGSSPEASQNSSPVVQPSLDKNYLSIGEGVTTLLSGSLEEATLESYDAGSDLELNVALVPERNGLSIEAPHVDSPRVVTLLLVFANGDSTFHEEVSVHIRNTSAQQLEQQVRNIINDSLSLLGLEQDLALYQFSIDFAYLNGLIPNSEKTQLLNAFTPERSPAHLLLKSELSKLATSYSDYSQGLLKDSELEQTVESINELARQHGRYGIDQLARVSHFSEVIVPTLTSGSMVLSDEAGFFSRFVGNPEYGTWQDDRFELTPPYDKVSSLIRSKLSQDIRCDAI
ncbi:hypothetical protein [Marinobacter sp. SS13-12]|uniref:hypothetical protein n=1 Tax=Marinobacter sp. SS13-12 TaxID=3050451 RepID=UPI002553D329|nr:hypothetical protein [Marinobacter sp. SS13-12]MDK8465900.1 hypothetical protein [Marinobacter sp. SS13-12]